MIHSMTAFARSQSQGDWGTATWEIRSVNHRYLEASIRLPESLRDLENKFREILQKSLSRGKVECYLRYNPGLKTGAEITFNDSLLQSLVTAAQKIASQCKNPTTMDVMKMMAWPGVIQIAEVSAESVQQALVKSFEEALTQLVTMREREGKVIHQLVMARLQLIEAEITKLKPQLPKQLDLYREKLLKRLEEIRVEYDENRFEQEMVFLTQKADISEEIDRLITHITEVRKTLMQGGVVGRRLDFLMQELNREANTLSSKSIESVTTQAAVEIKVLIEQMREQIQNLE